MVERLKYKIAQAVCRSKHLPGIKQYRIITLDEKDQYARPFRPISPFFLSVFSVSLWSSPRHLMSTGLDYTRFSSCFLANNSNTWMCLIFEFLWYNTTLDYFKAR